MNAYGIMHSNIVRVCSFFYLNYPFTSFEEQPPSLVALWTIVEKYESLSKEVIPHGVKSVNREKLSPFWKKSNV